MHGLWAHLDWDMDKKIMVLRFVLDLENNLRPLPMIVGPWPIQEALAKVLDEVNYQVSRAGLKPLARNETTGRELAKMIQPFLSLLLYLCSDESDMKGPRASVPQRPKAKKTRKGLRLFPAEKPTIWHVGETVGQMLREARSGVSTSGFSPRPHIRRPHWHGYWTSPLDGDRHFGYKWLPAIMVKGRLEEKASAPACL